MGLVLTSLHTPPSVRLCLQLTLGRLLAVLVRYQRLLPDALADGNVDAARLLPADPLALPAALQWLHVALQRAGTGGRMVSATSAARVVEVHQGRMYPRSTTTAGCPLHKKTSQSSCSINPVRCTRCCYRQHLWC